MDILFKGFASVKKMEGPRPESLATKEFFLDIFAKKYRCFFHDPVQQAYRQTLVITNACKPGSIVRLCNNCSDL